jgi:hypothetical protein
MKRCPTWFDSHEESREHSLNHAGALRHLLKAGIGQIDQGRGDQVVGWGQAIAQARCISLAFVGFGHVVQAVA